MPPSYKLDYNQKELCTKVQRKIPQKNQNIFKIPNPKKFVPEELILNKEKDPEKEKKQ